MFANLQLHYTTQLALHNYITQSLKWTKREDKLLTWL